MRGARPRAAGRCTAIQREVAVLIRLVKHQRIIHVARVAALRLGRQPPGREEQGSFSSVPDMDVPTDQDREGGADTGVRNLAESVGHERAKKRRPPEALVEERAALDSISEGPGIQFELSTEYCIHSPICSTIRFDRLDRSAFCGSSQDCWHRILFLRSAGRCCDRTEGRSESQAYFTWDLLSLNCCYHL